MNPDPARAELREALLQDNQEGWSYRELCVVGFGGEFSHTVLQRIVKDGKFPKEPRILRLLGVVEKRTRTDIQRAIAKMAKGTRKALKVINGKTTRIL